MCEGAFSSPYSMCFHDQPSATMLFEGVLEVAGDRRVGALVDRHAGGRVRDVDEHGRAPFAPWTASRTSYVISTSWLWRSVWMAISRTALSYAAADRTAHRSELDAFRQQADRFLAEWTEEEYMHYAGHKDSSTSRRSTTAIPS